MSAQRLNQIELSTSLTRSQRTEDGLEALSGALLIQPFWKAQDWLRAKETLLETIMDKEPTVTFHTYAATISGYKRGWLRNIFQLALREGLVTKVDEGKFYTVHPEPHERLPKEKEVIQRLAHSLVEDLLRSFAYSTRADFERGQGRVEKRRNPPPKEILEVMSRIQGLQAQLKVDQFDPAMWVITPDSEADLIGLMKEVESALASAEKLTQIGLPKTMLDTLQQAIQEKLEVSQSEVYFKWSAHGDPGKDQPKAKSPVTPTNYKNWGDEEE
jgi:hypothetical protein